MLKAIYHSKYNTVDKNNNGIVMFRYLVSGKPEELAQYKAAQGEFYRENEEGRVMFFTPNYNGDNITLGITSKGKVYPDTAELDKLSSLVNRYPGALGTAIANLGAQKILSGLGGASAQVSNAPVESAGDSGKLDE